LDLDNKPLGKEVRKRQYKTSDKKNIHKSYKKEGGKVLSLRKRGGEVTCPETRTVGPTEFGMRFSVIKKRIGGSEKNLYWLSKCHPSSGMTSNRSTGKREGHNFGGRETVVMACLPIADFQVSFQGSLEEPRRFF